MKEILSRVGLRFKTSLGSRRVSSTNFLPISLGKTRIGCPMSQKSRIGNSPSKKPSCSMCDTKHWGECLVGMENCYGGEKMVRKVIDCPNVTIQEK